MKLKVLFFSVLCIQGTAVFAAEKHSMMMHHEHKTGASNKILTEAGNDAFGTIGEVIVKLNNDPKTDWRKVNLEVLRQHLLDMNDMTINVDVVSQKLIPNGLEVTVRATTHRAELALTRAFKAHPLMLKRETGWTMKVVKNNGLYILTTTSENSNDTLKIRGLGYIGWMAYGTHHQSHHWAMATGKKPHAKHH